MYMIKHVSDTCFRCLEQTRLWRNAIDADVDSTRFQTGIGHTLCWFQCSFWNPCFVSIRPFPKSTPIPLCEIIAVRFDPELVWDGRCLLDRNRSGVKVVSALGFLLFALAGTPRISETSPQNLRNRPPESQKWFHPSMVEMVLCLFQHWNKHPQ